ncbi:MAG: pentapeptide repeat-containing protein [Nitrospinae bacterium]|nr:pentapeptide repeat-containing protein [Nitrospinota bacterium]
MPTWRRRTCRGANLQNADLSAANLQEANLHGVNLQNAHLFGTNLQQAVLWEANLQMADLFKANLQKAILLEATLKESGLQNANLGEATGLLVGQLAGANVSGAELPKSIGQFEGGLKFVEETSKAARKLFLALLLGCAYSVLTIYGTSDPQLLTNSTSSKLPIIGTGIPIAGFFGVAPALLLAMFIYLHLYLENLWNGLAQLPAIFPNGRPLDKEAHPWLINGLVRWHVHHLKGTHSFVVHLQNFILTVLVLVGPPIDHGAVLATVSPKARLASHRISDSRCCDGNSVCGMVPKAVQAASSRQYTGAHLL